MEKNDEPIRLGINNVESIVFEDWSVWREMPDMRRFRDQWAVSRISPSLKPTGNAAIMGFLDALTHEHEALLSKHFGRPVTIDRFERGCVRNLHFHIDCPPDLEDMSMFSGMGTYRNGDTLHVTFWR